MESVVLGEESVVLVVERWGRLTLLLLVLIS